MRGILDRALVRLDESMGWGTARKRVRRVELHRDGGIVLTLEGPGPRQWFRVLDEDLTEMTPDTDSHLPLCQERAEEITAGALEVLSWRPGRRIVLSDRTGRPRVLKGYRRGRSLAAAERHTRAESALGVQSGLRTAHLEDHHADAECLAFEFVEGHPVKIDSADAETFRTVGRGLASLREGLDGAELGSFGATDELEVLDTLHSRRLELAGELEGWRPLRARVGSLLADLPADEFTATHRDLHDGQLIASGSQVTLLDLDLLTTAHPALDPGNLTAHLQLRALQNAEGATQHGAELGARALLDGMGVTPSLTALRIYQASSFLRLTLIYAMRPRWFGVVPDLIHFARRSLADVDQ